MIELFYISNVYKIVRKTRKINLIQLSPINAQYIKTQKESNAVKQTSLIKNTNTSTIAKVPTAKERAMTVGIGLGIIGVIAGAVFLIKRCTIPPKYKELFKSLNKINDYEEFVQSAYKGIVKCENMQDIAPKEISFSYGLGRGVIGAYNPRCNTIEITKDEEVIKNYPKSAMFGTIRHELEHCKQCNWMLRHMGKDKYLQHVHKDSVELSFKLARGKFQNMDSQEIIKEFFEKKAEELEKGFSYTLSQPKLELSKKELDKLCWYMASQGITPEKYGEAYAKSPIEKEAHRVGDKVEAWYKRFNSGKDPFFKQ